MKILGDASYVRALSHKPNILRNTSMAARHGNESEFLSRKVKEMIASSISMFNGCEYCVTSHVGFLKDEYEFTDEETVEIAAVVGHVTGLDLLEKAARTGLFQSSNDLPSSNEILLEIKNNFEHKVPSSFMLASRDGELLAILWNREKVTMQEGKIEKWVKELIALYISISDSCLENAEIRLKQAERLGVKKEAILEGLWVAERFSKNSKIIEGLLLEPNQEESHTLSKAHS